MTRPDFTVPRRIETEYARHIFALISEHLSGARTPAEVLKAFATLSSNPKILQAMAQRVAAKMVTMTKAANARSWREAARQAGRGREIYEALQEEMQTGVGKRTRELVAENAKLIGSIPGKLREHVNNEILAMQQTGARPEAITEYLSRRVPQLTRWQAKLIARTETAKSVTALTQARSEDLGAAWYQWLTAEDQRVRPSHRIMDKVLVSWDDPPNPETLNHERNDHSPYQAGGIYNCRCIALPILNLDLISWPAKVYRRGRITRMTRGQFARLAGLSKAA